MGNDWIVVDGYVPTALDDTDLRRDAWSFALDQRAFGPRRLLVAFADADGRLRGLAHTHRTDPPEDALAPCIKALGAGAAIAVAFCDEPVIEGPPPPDLPARFARASEIATAHGLFLVDWFACDDEAFRSGRLALHPDEPWWAPPHS
jgi:hypothetical protein